MDKYIRPVSAKEYGGEGSGNFGHAGRPGEVGGSGGGVGIGGGREGLGAEKSSVKNISNFMNIKESSAKAIKQLADTGKWKRSASNDIDDVDMEKIISYTPNGLVANLNITQKRAGQIKSALKDYYQKRSSRGYAQDVIEIKGDDEKE